MGRGSSPGSLSSPGKNQRETRTELVWNRLNAGQTQQAVADGIGWSRAQVSQYAMLQKIDAEVWKVVATSFQQVVADEENEAVAGSATTVAGNFSERLLREILDLTADQQLNLCKKLAKGKDGKGPHLKRDPSHSDGIELGEPVVIPGDLANSSAVLHASPNPVYRLGQITGNNKTVAPRMAKRLRLCL